MSKIIQKKGHFVKFGNNKINKKSAPDFSAAL